MDEDTKSSVGSLKSIMEEEEEKRRLSRLRNMVRHSQFSGTFTRLTMVRSSTDSVATKGLSFKDLVTPIALTAGWFKGSSKGKPDFCKSRYLA